MRRPLARRTDRLLLLRASLRRRHRRDEQPRRRRGPRRPLPWRGGVRREVRRPRRPLPPPRTARARPPHRGDRRTHRSRAAAGKAAHAARPRRPHARRARLVRARPSGRHRARRSRVRPHQPVWPAAAHLPAPPGGPAASLPAGDAALHLRPPAGQGPGGRRLPRARVSRVQARVCLWRGRVVHEFRLHAGRGVPQPAHLHRLSASRLPHLARRHQHRAAVGQTHRPPLPRAPPPTPRRSRRAVPTRLRGGAARAEGVAARHLHPLHGRPDLRRRPAATHPRLGRVHPARRHARRVRSLPRRRRSRWAARRVKRPAARVPRHGDGRGWRHDQDAAARRGGAVPPAAPLPRANHLPAALRPAARHRAARSRLPARRRRRVRRHAAAPPLPQEARPLARRRRGEDAAARCGRRRERVRRLRHGRRGEARVATGVGVPVLWPRPARPARRRREGDRPVPQQLGRLAAARPAAPLQPGSARRLPPHRAPDGVDGGLVCLRGRRGRPRRLDEQHGRRLGRRARGRARGVAPRRRRRPAASAFDGRFAPGRQPRAAGAPRRLWQQPVHDPGRRGRGVGQRFRLDVRPTLGASLGRRFGGDPLDAPPAQLVGPAGGAGGVAAARIAIGHMRTHDVEAM
mmetsp:Transcript_17321/g.52605  ORF Transcript_17321/g.52605 Transcript_17321/m.52605 type:complete len:631 (-) Transcript_17321:20-1912(-)